MTKVSKNRSWPLIITFMICLVMLIMVLYEIFNINIDPDILEDSTVEIRKIEAKRGNILASDGKKLSTSMPVYDIRLDMVAIRDQLFYRNLYPY